MTVKQVCLGIAVAGVVAGTGSAIATAVAYADAGPSDSQGGASAGPSSSGSPSTARSHKPAPKTGVANTPRRAGGAPATRRTVARAAQSAVAVPQTGTPETAPPAPSPAVPASVKPASALPNPLPVPAQPVAPVSTLTITSTGYSYRARSASAAAAVFATHNTVDPTNVHVLVIGVDGTNMRRILADPTNVNFFNLMGASTTGIASIAGHTTISNPSWTAILTGAWDNQSGVINNVFTAGTYDKWPTVFTQLEAYNRDINTMAIADWSVITDIAGAGVIPADTVTFVPKVPGDSNWSLTDAAVTSATVAALQGTAAPNFLFSYLVQVDEAGHEYGGASSQYAEAIHRTDDNLGQIMAAVAAREAAGENWTVIVVTDHGHQPQVGFGHGFQSPDETSTWVIANGDAFGAGQLNMAYSIVDVTPTVMDLFGGPAPQGSTGVSLTTLGESQVTPVNPQQAIKDAIATQGWPDIATNVALSARTIFATLPYWVNGTIYTLTSELQKIASQDTFLISQLAQVAQAAVQVIGGVVYAATDVLAQLVALLTGVDIFSKGYPIDPPPAAARPSVLVA
ncbi:phosphodiesterase [Mycolicibacterium sp. CH28]|uniref:alkaline phosphatase family protein n=1 Tax=Mycolicibacterium sp. CH28 TaxID=2512237 RepID=UPI0010805D19|nr:alkaline phosphatase family protein [Mycolicibacterium sp. CH28]TGD89194.1 phosphodiesterase [Mycolicibacterium sp. CH28]